jgi:hypothetical protein
LVDQTFIRNAFPFSNTNDVLNFCSDAVFGRKNSELISLIGRSIGVCICHMGSNIGKRIREMASRKKFEFVIIIAIVRV